MSASFLPILMGFLASLIGAFVESRSVSPRGAHPDRIGGTGCDMQKPPRIRLFGPVTVEAGDRTLGPSDFGGTKPKHVLEILLLSRGAAVAKYRLMDVLWGDRVPAGALGALETHVSVLRSRLGVPRPLEIRSVSETYATVVEPCDLDLDRFDDALQHAARAPHAEARLYLEHALLLGGSVLLEDEPYAEWAIAIRERYARLVHDASVMLAEIALEADQPAEALLYSDAALARDRLSERAVRVWMRAAYRLGRQHDALLTYKRVTKLLRAELRVPPMDETTDLNKAIRRHDGPAVMTSRESSPALTVAPPGHAIGGTSLAHHLDWLPSGRTSNPPTR